MLLKDVHFLEDTAGRSAGLHYIRTMDGAEVDFSLSEDGKIVHMIECKWGGCKPHRGLMRFAEQFSDAVQVVYGLRQEESRNSIKTPMLLTGYWSWRRS